MSRRVDVEQVTHELRPFARALSARGECFANAVSGPAEMRADALVRLSARSVEDAADRLDGAQLRIQMFSAAIQHNRALLRRERFESGAAPARQAAFADSASPAARAAGVQTAVTALAQLADEAREVLLLVALAQFSYAQAAQALGLSLSQTLERLTSARAAFGAALDRADDTAAGAFAARLPAGYPQGRRPAAQYLRLVK